jgi:drug/metabolite transporter (DMT)-like permease
LELLLCLLGQFLLFKDNVKDFADPNYAIGIVAILIANIAWAIGTVYSKNHKSDTLPFVWSRITNDLRWNNFGYCRDSKRRMVKSYIRRQMLVWALVYLIIFGSIIAYGAYMYVLKKLPATIVSTYSYVNTVVAVFLGWLWLR